MKINKITYKAVLALFTGIIISSCTTTSYNVEKELSKIEECKLIEPFYTKSRVCLKNSVIASEVLHPELVVIMEELTDLLEARVNSNKISNEMAWKLFQDNLILATEPSDSDEVDQSARKIKSFLKTLL